MPDKKDTDYRLYFVADAVVTGGRTLEWLTEQAITGGATIIQLRYKPSGECTTREFLEEARLLRAICAGTGVPFLINDRVDIALAVDADGVHIGQDDMPLATARQILGADKIIGVTAHSSEEAREAEQGGADYIGASALFATPSKSDAGEGIGFAGLKRIAEAVSLPVVAIGGVKAEHVSECIRNGAAGIAVISAISLADDPAGAARELRKRFPVG